MVWLEMYQMSWKQAWGPNSTPSIMSVCATYSNTASILLGEFFDLLYLHSHNIQSRESQWQKAIIIHVTVFTRFLSLSMRILLSSSASSFSVRASFSADSSDTFSWWEGQTGDRVRRTLQSQKHSKLIKLLLLHCGPERNWSEQTCCTIKHFTANMKNELNTSWIL